MNDGNASDTFAFYTDGTQTGGSIGSPWSVTWKPGSTATLGTQQVTTVTMQVVIDSAAADGSYVEFRVECASTNTNSAIMKRRYVGDYNGIVYGGDMGIQWDGTSTNNDGILRTVVANYGATTNGWIRVTAQVSCSAVNVTGFSPSSGCVGDTVTITGSGFESVTNYVAINGIAAQITSWTDNQIVVTITNVNQSGVIYVSNYCGSNFTTSSNFTVKAGTVNITGFSPSSGCVGDTLTITGTGFGIVTNYVAINGMEAQITSWTDNQIVVTITNISQSGQIFVSNVCASTQTTSSNFTVNAGTVNITGFSPSSGCVGDTLIITGTGFGIVTNYVAINGMEAQVTSWSDTQIVVTITNINQSGPIFVSNACASTQTTSSNTIIEAYIQLTKSVSNVKLGGVNETAIPGATITYAVYYTNQGCSGVDVLVYDALDQNTSFSNNSMSAPAGWTNQYSTNSSPNQVWNSLDYTSTQPPATQVKWVRWKKPSVATGEAGYIYYKVIIK